MFRAPSTAAESTRIEDASRPILDLSEQGATVVERPHDVEFDIAPVAVLALPTRPSRCCGLSLAFIEIALALRGAMSFLNARTGILDLAFNLELVQPLFWSENSVQHQTLTFDRGKIAWGKESHE